MNCGLTWLVEISTSFSEATDSLLAQPNGRHLPVVAVQWDCERVYLLAVVPNGENYPWWQLWPPEFLWWTMVLVFCSSFHQHIFHHNSKLMKIYCILISSLTMISIEILPQPWQQCCHVLCQIYRISLLKFGWEQNETSLEFKLWWKIVSEMGQGAKWRPVNCLTFDVTKNNNKDICCNESYQLQCGMETQFLYARL